MAEAVAGIPSLDRAAGIGNTFRTNDVFYETDRTVTFGIEDGETPGSFGRIFHDSGTNQFRIETADVGGATSPDMVFLTDSIEAVRILQSNQFVGVGTSGPTSTFDVNGSVSIATTVIAATPTALGASDNVALVDATAAPVTITLPAIATVLGRMYRIKKTDASANAVTIDPAAAETIDGAATKVLATQFEETTIVANSTGWHIIGGSGSTGPVGNAFVQNGNSFGTLATLGTNDGFALAFETSGVERGRFLTTGPFMVNTQTATSSFALIGAEETINNARSIDIKNPSSGTAASVSFLAISNSGRNAQMGHTSSGFTPVGGLLANDAFFLNSSLSGSLTILTTSASPIRFSTTTIERARFLATGPIFLIGTTTQLNSLVRLQLEDTVAGNMSLLVRNTNAGGAAQVSVGLKNDSAGTSPTVSMSVTGTGIADIPNSSTPLFGATTLALSGGNIGYSATTSHTWGLAGVVTAHLNATRLTLAATLGPDATSIATTVRFLINRTGYNTIQLETLTASQSVGINFIPTNAAATALRNWQIRAGGFGIDTFSLFNNGSEFWQCDGVGTQPFTLFRQTNISAVATSAAGDTRAFIINGAVHGVLDANEALDVDWALDRTVTFSASFALQRAVLIKPPTYAGSVPGIVITTAATVAISGAPVAGTNMTITNSFALDVTGATRVTGKLTVTGAIDPTSVLLSGGTELFYESNDGSTAPVSGAATGRLRYNNSTGTWQVSTQTSPYRDLAISAAANNLPFTFAFFTSANPYIEKNSTSFAAIGNFAFRGTGISTPTRLTITASRDGSTGTATVRLQDITNANTIAEINFTAAGVAVYEDTSLTNLPAGSAVFEVQAKKDAGPSSKVRVHSIALE